MQIAREPVPTVDWVAPGSGGAHQGVAYVAAFTCSFSAAEPYLWQEQRVLRSFF